MSATDERDDEAGPPSAMDEAEPTTETGTDVASDGGSSGAADAGGDDEPVRREPEVPRPRGRLRLRRRAASGPPHDQSGSNAADGGAFQGGAAPGGADGAVRRGVQPRLSSLGPEPLEPFPDSLEDGTQLAVALGAGTLPGRPETVAHRRGRLRRWYTSVAVSDDWTLGATVMHRGLLGSATAWLHDGDRTWSWGHFGLSLRTSTKGPRVRRTPGERAFFVDDDVLVVVRSGGELDLRADLASDDGSVRRVRARLLALPDTPMSLSTTTRLEGWNTTTKSAGHEVTGELSVRALGADGVAGPEPSVRSFRGLGFTDWTAGRQDRRTEWTWACAAGLTDDGRRVGLNASTGMNAAGPGEDVLWADGEPHALVVDPSWGPLDDDEPGGPWRLAGEGWQLRLDPTGRLDRTEARLMTTTSSTLAVGTWRGTVPLPDGSLRHVALRGIAQAQQAKW